MGWITRILNQLVDHQPRGPIHSPDELGAGAARARPIPILHSFLLLFLCHFLEITKRIPGLGLSGRGAAVGIGNVFSSLIHSVARNPSLAKQLFGYAILGFALTEAIASFASMMAFLISSVFWSKKEGWTFILTTIFLKQIVHSAHSIDTVKANSCFHSIFITKMYHVRIRCSNRITPTLWKFLDRVK